MVDDKLRSILDGLEERQLLQLRSAVTNSPDGSTHEIEGIQVPKGKALQLINQALPVQADPEQDPSPERDAPGDDQLREFLDSLDEEELTGLRDSVAGTPPGSTQEIHGIQLSRERALRLINQSMPVARS